MRATMKLPVITKKWEAVGLNQRHARKTPEADQLRPWPYEDPKGGHMNKQFIMALTMFSLVVPFAVTSANAQSGTHFIRIVIPFEFIIKGETLPPGTYTVKRLSSDKPETLLLSRTD